VYCPLYRYDIFFLGGERACLAGKAGFPFIVGLCRLFFVSCAWASSVSLHQPTKISAAISPSYHFNPCRCRFRSNPPTFNISNWIIRIIKLSIACPASAGSLGIVADVRSSVSQQLSMS